jgi:regulator of protease activity HflC (stomatin/prohibitin superfamily)
MGNSTRVIEGGQRRRGEKAISRFRGRAFTSWGPRAAGSVARRDAGYLPPGRYAFWKNVAKATLVPMDMRETMLDVAGQEIMTADKVTLRMNAVITYRVADAKMAVSVTDDVCQALYREAQLALRAAVGTRELDQFLADKDTIAREMEEIIRRRVTALGLEVVSAGIRDVILPGDMKDLMNKVTEAKKAAEAEWHFRR